MSLFDQQFAFDCDVISLSNYIKVNGWKFSWRECQRGEIQQKYNVDHGYSSTMNSKHLEALAIDIILKTPSGKVLADAGDFKSLTDSETRDLESFAVYWESLGHKWGGRWVKPYDPYHWEV